MNYRNVLIECYHEWFNRWLTVEAFAECHGLTLDEATRLIQLAREVVQHPHPEA